MTANATPEYLTRGAWYALEQAGWLLNDAVILFDSDRFGSAVALAMFGREELGKARLLFDLAGQVSDDRRPLTIDDVDARLNARDAHLEKQRRAALSITLRSPGDDQLGKLMRRRLELEPGTPEYERAHAELDALTRQIQKRAPDERHRARQRGLYVDPDGLGGWSRPGEIAQDEAFTMVNDALNDYSVYCRNLKVDQQRLGPGASGVLDKWPTRPTLPVSRRPAWPRSSPSPRSSLELGSSSADDR